MKNVLPAETPVKREATKKGFEGLNWESRPGEKKKFELEKKEAEARKGDYGYPRMKDCERIPLGSVGGSGAEKERP